MTNLRIRPQTFLVASVGISGILIGLGLGNLPSGSDPAASAGTAGTAGTAPGQVTTPTQPVGQSVTTARATRAAAVRAAAAPASTGTHAGISAAGATTKSAAATATSTTSAVAVAEAFAVDDRPPNPPASPSATGPTPVKGNPDIDVAVEGDPCTVEERSGVTSDNSKALRCTVTDDGLRWLPAAP